MGPHPHPTSSRWPVSGGVGVPASSTAVPGSTRPGLKTPAAVVNVSSRPARTTSIVLGLAALPGWGEK